MEISEKIMLLNNTVLNYKIKIENIKSYIDDLEKHKIDLIDNYIGVN